MDSPASQSLLARLFTVEIDRLTPSEATILRCLTRVCWVIVPLATLFAMASTYRDIRMYSGDDLRNRVVGARVMLAGYDPYTFVWQADMPEQWLDPVYDPKAHRLTASPPTLLLYALIAPCPYTTQRLISFLCEWLALLASLALLTRTLPDNRQRLVFLLGATLFVTASDVWRLHVERGQMYVFNLLALSAAIAWSRRGQDDSLAAGMALGILALLRPNLLVIAPVLLILRQWRSAGAMLTTVGVGIAATAFFLPMSSWQNYLRVGEQYFRAIQDPMSVPDLPRPLYEGPVEGVQFCFGLPNVESSSFALLYRSLYDRVGLPAIDLALTSKLIMLALAALLLMLVWRRRGDVRSAFALIIVLSLDTEFFLPHRWGYSDVMLLAPVALLLPALMCNRLALGMVLFGCLCVGIGQLFIGLYAATVLRSWLVMGGLTALAIDNGAANSTSRDG
jgi:hypothetical protein